MDEYDAPDDQYAGVRQLVDRPPEAVDWTSLDAETAAREWRDLDLWVTWLKSTFGLPPSIVPPQWHRHDELIWELSALHTHWLSCYHESASPSAPMTWMRDFAEARNRLRDWVSICGTRLDRDRPTRQTTWPSEPDTTAAGEAPVIDRRRDFEDFVREDLRHRPRSDGDSVIW